MPDQLPNTLARCVSKGYVIAPAGYGKTHLIALAVKAGSNRQLILTHTFAGVNSIKSKMTYLGVPSSRYQVDTIASWSLRLCLAYPRTSGWKVENPTSKQWNPLYESCRDLLSKKFIRHVVGSTYSGVYVDEYQDCSDVQHTLVCALADFLPCRILGDPLQAIFDFADKPVDWDASIYPHFECLGQLETPWRWDNAGAHELGAWLKAARATLQAGQKVNLNGALPKGVKRISVDPQFLSAKQYSILCDFLGNDATVIALHGGDQQSKNKTHLLARTMAGKFSSIEEVEGKDLLSFIKKLQAAKTVNAGFLLVLDFAKKCFTGIDKILVAGTKRGEVAKQTKATKYPLVLASANRYLGEPSSSNLRDFFCVVRDNPETSTYRRDLLNRFMNILKIHVDGEAATLLESANSYQRELRHTGRPLRHKKLIGTTLLVKGLEYDHAILLEADSLELKELYVAMTRGSKSLTIISSSNTIPKP
ncbi:UvrD-helicase domain-containing protein [Burkholderia vietnamiensis]|uniref:UvrD-helicase domain-containing protein n=1 Tax=Burkholderia vietnamiensis TaxID=60552 RepID=UPI001B8F5D55|nr:UvrD-helicase domain-containing protein [Burkholderia vietnamiensis]MBR8147385.1 AAA family ATPase [Burkholderia vietnamiensis]